MLLLHAHACARTHAHTHTHTHTHTQNETYVFTVIASDNGKPESFNSTAEVTLVVFSPDNHFNPVLNQTIYEATVDENDGDPGPQEQVVVYFSVSDEDLVGPASQIGEIELIGVDAVYFTVEQIGTTNSGVVKTK